MAPRSRSTPTLRGRAHPRMAQLALEDPWLVGQVSRNSLARLGDRERGGRELLPEKWQARAYDLTFDKVGELAYVVNLKAATIARGSLEVVEWDPDTGNRVPEEESNYREVWAAARANLRKLRGEAGDYHAVLRDWSMHDQVAGEAYLVGEPIGQTNQIGWEMLSVLEIRNDSQGTTRTESASSSNRQHRERKLGDSVFVGRYHRRDPRHSDDAISMIKRVLSIADQIARLDSLIDIMINGKLPADMLVIPSEVSFGFDDDDVYDTDENDSLVQADPFDEALAAHMDAPIQDPASPAAYTPFVVRMPGEFADKAKLLSLSTDRHSWAIELREKNVERLGRELDIPPEVITGKGGLNDWSAFNVDQDFIIKHVVEDGERGARFFSVQYLRKILVAEDDIKPEVAARFEFEYDGSILVARQDESANARALYDRAELSSAALMKAHGFDSETDAPTPQEVLLRAFLNFPGRASVSALNAGVFDAVAAMLGIELTKSSAIDPAADAEQTAEAKPEGAEQSEPAEGVDANSGVDMPDRSMTIQVHAAALAGHGHVLARARNMIAGRADRVDGLRHWLDENPGVPKLADADFATLGLSPSAMLAGSFDPMKRCVVDVVARHLEDRGLDSWTALDVAQVRADRVCSTLEAMTAHEVATGQPAVISPGLIAELLQGAP